MSLFGKPKMPEPQPMPQPPSDEGAEENAKNMSRMRRLFATGRQSTILAGWGGQNGQGTGYKTTMG